MSDPSRLLPALLAPALAAARAALRRLETDEVPASLRRVAAYSGGRLPPPLQRSLLDELDGSEWLRAKALEELGEGDGLDRLYLERPPGWGRALAEAAAAYASEQADAEVAAATKRAADVEAKLAEARRRRREERAARPQAEDTGSEADELRRKLKAAHQRSAAEVERLEGELEAARARAAGADDAIARLAAEGQRLRSQLRRARRDRARLEAAAHAGGGAMGRRAPLAMARDLDEAARLLRPAPRPAAAAQEPGVRPPLELPAGVRPDDAAAIDWLVEQPEPALLLVDGYNVTFTLSERGFATPEARSRLEAELGRLARLGAALKVAVVYDSDQDHEPSVAVGAGGVEVVFAPADRLADEELVARAAAASIPAVVVSTDREVREGAEEAGALALWGEALVGWMRRRT